MKERPILFSGPMVRAIIDGRKTMTRRVVKNAHVITCDDKRGATDTPCPFGVPGDRLWVRESLLWKCRRIEETCVESGHVYAATPDEWVEEYVNQKPMPRKNIPSIHMPRWASRLLLEVVSVRVERLQKISKADAIAEGIERTGDGRWRHYQNPHYAFSPDPIESFGTLWRSISGEGSWDANPRVRVVEFRRITP